MNMTIVKCSHLIEANLLLHNMYVTNGYSYSVIYIRMCDSIILRKRRLDLPRITPTLSHGCRISRQQVGEKWLWVALLQKCNEDI